MAAENGQTARDIYLAELRGQVERLNALIAAVESEGENLSGTPTTGSRLIDTHVRPDSFYGMTTPGAVKKFLEMMGKGNPQTAQAIGEALVNGGFDKRENLETVLKNVYTAFKRGKNTDFVKIGKVWGLKEWYPNVKVGDDKQAKTTKTKKTPKATPKSKRALPDAPRKHAGLDAYNSFVKEQVASGKTREEAISAWKQRATG